VIYFSAEVNIMFDNLRDSSFYEEEPDDLSRETEVEVRTVAGRRRSPNGRFLGMTAQQRFLLSLMFMMTVCVMGVLAMVVLGRMSLF
jgi:hypothetical protein